MTAHRKGWSCALLYSVLGNESAAGWREAVTATVVGTVKDTSQAIVPGATIEATRVGTDVVRSTVTNDRGDYTLVSLQPGIYQVSADVLRFQARAP